MKYFDVTLYDFILYSLGLIQLCPSSKHISNSLTYDRDDFWGGYFSSDHTRALRELF